MKIPPGTANGKTLRVRGRGGPRPGGGDGDLLVKIQVQVPQKLTRQEKDLLEKFAEAHKASPRTEIEEQLKSSSGRKVS